MLDKNCNVVNSSSFSSFDLPCGTESTFFEAFIKPLPTATIEINNESTNTSACKLELIVKQSDGSKIIREIAPRQSLTLLVDSVKKISLKCVGGITETSNCTGFLQLLLSYCQCCKN
jgi:hypothetical protein